MTKTKTKAPRLGGYTLSALADALGVPRRTLRDQADRGLIVTLELEGGGSRLRLRFVPIAEARRLLRSARKART